MSALRSAKKVADGLLGESLMGKGDSDDGVPCVLARFNFRCGGGGGAFTVDGAFGKDVGEDGLGSSAAKAVAELFIACCGVLLFIWLCRLVKGGVGGRLVRVGGPDSGVGVSILGAGKDKSTDGGGNGLSVSLVTSMMGPCEGGEYVAADDASPIPKVVTVPEVEGGASASCLPCLVLGTDGFCREGGAAELYMLRLSTLTSSRSSSCDVRGVSIEVLVTGSKID
jgi:hypothetical protein